MADIAYVLHQQFDTLAAMSLPDFMRWHAMACERWPRPRPVVLVNPA